jgi:hypothetical protein
VAISLPNSSCASHGSEFIHGDTSSIPGQNTHPGYYLLAFPCAPAVSTAQTINRRLPSTALLVRICAVDCGLWTNTSISSSIPFGLFVIVEARVCGGRERKTNQRNRVEHSLSLLRQPSSVLISGSKFRIQRTGTYRYVPVRTVNHRTEYVYRPYRNQYVPTTRTVDEHQYGPVQVPVGPTGPYIGLRYGHVSHHQQSTRENPPVGPTGSLPGTCRTYRYHPTQTPRGLCLPHLWIAPSPYRIATLDIEQRTYQDLG